MLDNLEVYISFKCPSSKKIYLMFSHALTSGLNRSIPFNPMYLRDTCEPTHIGRNLFRFATCSCPRQHVDSKVWKRMGVGEGGHYAKVFPSSTT
jgi:hypothetical protein